MIHDDEHHNHSCPLTPHHTHTHTLGSTFSRAVSLTLTYIVFATAIVARTVTDGAIFAPFATCLFYASQGTMEGRPWRSTAEIQGINERLRERLWGTVQKQWCVFGPAQVINLTLIPLYARPPFMNMVSDAFFFCAANC